MDLTIIYITITLLIFTTVSLKYIFDLQKAKSSINYIVDINSNIIKIHNIDCNLVNENSNNSSDLFDLYDEASKHAKLESLLNGYECVECKCCSPKFKC